MMMIAPRFAAIGGLLALAAAGGYASPLPLPAPRLSAPRPPKSRDAVKAAAKKKAQRQARRRQRRS